MKVALTLDDLPVWPPECPTSSDGKHGAYMGVAKEGNVRVGDRLTVEFKASE